jgi:alpha-galactosidase
MTQDKIEFELCVSEAGDLAFRTPGIEFSGGRPAVCVLLGPDEQEREFLGEGPGRLVATETCSTPGGRCELRSRRWELPHGLALSWTVGRFLDRPGLLLSAVFHNESSEPVRLREIVLCHSSAGALRCEGDPAAWRLQPLRAHIPAGNLAEVLTDCKAKDTGVTLGKLDRTQRHDDPRWRTYSDHITLYTDCGERGLAMGPGGLGVADIRYDCGVENGTIQLGIVSEMTDIIVDPGQSRAGESVIILAGPYETALRDVMRYDAQKLAARNHRKPVFGWSSWYDLYREISTETVTATIDAIAEDFDRVPVQVIQIDDGYQDDCGDWTPGAKFPGGWAPIVERIQRLGVQPGVWVAPLMVAELLGWHEEHPDWFQRDADGALEQFVYKPGRQFFLDPTHPEVRKFIRRVLQDLCDAGFTYFKFDFNRVAAARFHDPRLTRRQVHRDMYRLFRECIGDGAYAGGTVGYQGVGIFDYARVGPDTGPRWHHPKGGAICLKYDIRCVAQAALSNGVWFTNDPDVAYTLPREDMDDEETRTWLSVVGIYGGQTVISEPLQSPAYHEALRRVEILAPPCPEASWSFCGATDPEHKQFGFVAERPWGDFATLVVYNPADEPADVPLPPRGLDALGERFHVWSFWDEKYLGLAGPEFVVRRLPAHGCAVLRLTPAQKDRPILIGSSLHISAGAAEIADVLVTPTGIEVRLTDGGARDGVLVLHSPHALCITDAVGCEATSCEAAAEGVWTVSLRGRRRGEVQSVTLAMQRTAL